MHIRLAQLDELHILENLARQIWPATYADIISQEQIDFMLNWMYSFPALRQQQEEGHEFYILNHEDQDIGFIAIEWINEPQQSDSAQLKINKLYVLTECQGKGMGRALFEKAKERATETGCKAIFLQVNKANQAKNFYLQLGFQVREEAVFDIGNGFVMDDYIMALALWVFCIFVNQNLTHAKNWHAQPYLAQNNAQLDAKIWLRQVHSSRA